MICFHYTEEHHADIWAESSGCQPEYDRIGPSAVLHNKEADLFSLFRFLRHSRSIQQLTGAVVDQQVVGLHQFIKGIAAA